MTEKGSPTRRVFRTFGSCAQVSHGKRLTLFFVLFAYFVVQLVIYQRRVHSGDVLVHRALVAVNVMLLACSLTALAIGWVLRPYVEHRMYFFNAMLSGLCVSWLVFATPTAASNAAFFSINMIIIFVLIAFDVSSAAMLHSSFPVHFSLRFAAAKGSRYGQLGKEDVERDVEQGVSLQQLTSNNIPEPLFAGLVIDTTDRRLCDGFRVNVTHLPQVDTALRQDLQWSDFDELQHVVDSSSCHIFTAIWGTSHVVLKLIKEERLSSPVAVAEFEIEEQVLSRIRHPNIVRLLGSGCIPRKFLVLELLAGGSLAQSLGLRADQNGPSHRAEQFSLVESLRLGVSLSRALRYLHHEWSNDVHVVHRDLKPDNIGWSADGTLKLFDFGLCACVRAQRDRSECYRLTGNTGTLRYMAPEVVLNRAYNQSVDVYSFAVLLWQVISRKVPFREMGKKTFFDRVVIGGQRLKLDPKWPSALSALLRRCWHEDKAQRPSFREIVPELETLLRQEEEVDRLRRERLSQRLIARGCELVTRIRPFMVIGLALLLLLALIIAFATPELEAGGTLAALISFVLYVMVMLHLNKKSIRPADASVSNQQVNAPPNKSPGHAASTNDDFAFNPLNVTPV